MIFSTILNIAYFVMMVLLLFGITIFIHELGHFWVARRLGMRAEVFSIGFGHAVWKKKIDGVLYKVGWIPCGGYVALPQMEPGGGTMEDEEGKTVPLPKIAPWRKILVALAGATGNIILAFILAFIIFWIGKPSSMQENSSMVGFVSTNSPAHEAGLRIGDEVLSVNGKPVTSWEDVLVYGALRDEVDLHVSTPEGEKDIHLLTEKGALGIKGVRGIPGVDGPSYCVVAEPLKDSSAEAAGVLPGDMIVSFSGVELYSIPHLVDLVNAHPNETVPMVVERVSGRETLHVTPSMNKDEDKVMIGVRFDRFHVNKTKLVHPRPSAQIKKHAGLIFKTLRALVTPSEARNAVGAIGGPPMIFQYLWAMLKTSLVMALWFTCLLNVNLAIINLLPIPVLDGGHIVFSLFEMVTRRSVNERFIGGLTAIFAVLLIGAMLFLSYRDIDRWVDMQRQSGGRDSKEAPADGPVPSESEPAPASP